MKNKNEKKKIFFLINSLTSGGAERIVKIISEQLSKKYEVKIITLEKEIFYETKVPVINLNQTSEKDNIIKRIFYFIISPFKLYNISKKYKPEVTISFLEISNYVNILNCYKNKKIISVRNNPNLVYSKGFYGRINKLLIKWLYPKANLIVSLSRGVKEELKKIIKFNNIVSIYNPINFDESQKLQKEKISKNEEYLFKNKPVYISIGSLTEQKKQKDLLNALKNTQGNLIILGEGNLRKDLENRIKKLGLKNRVFLIGRKKNVFKYLKKADCFVLSSHWEGFGNVISEALSTNIPVVSYDCKHGPKEILAPELKINEKIEYPYKSKYGILARTKDINNLKEAMEKAIKEKKTFKGKERAKQFKTENIIKEWEKMI